MPADASIFSPMLQRPKSPLEFANDYRTNELQAMALQDAQDQSAARADMTRRTTAANNALMALGGGATDDQRLGVLKQHGMFDQADKLQDSLIKRDKTRSEVAQAGATTAKTEWETKLAKHKQSINDIASFDTPDQARAALETGIRDGSVRPEMAQQLASSIPQDPAQFREWQKRILGSLIDAKDKLTLTQPKPQEINLGDRIVIMDMNPQSASFGKPLGAEMRRGASPDTVLSTNTQRELAAQGVKYETDAHGRVIALPTTGAGPAPRVVTGADGKPIVGKDGGGPKIGSEVNRQITGIMAYDRDLDALTEAMRDFNPRSGGDAFNAEKVARIKSIAKQAQLNAKEAAALGALSGPDMSLLEGILADPVSVRAAMLGKGGIEEQIKQSKEGNVRRFAALRDQYGDKAVPDAWRSRLPAMPAKPDGGDAPAPAPAKSGALDQARAAIAKGAPRDAVIQRLKAAGIDTTGL